MYAILFKKRGLGVCAVCTTMQYKAENLNAKNYILINRKTVAGIHNPFLISKQWLCSTVE